jgi:hypothetical protein
VNEKMPSTDPIVESVEARRADKATDAAIAEFNALRTEINTAWTAQATFSGIAFTAIGVIIGFALNKDGDARILIAIPFISALTISVYAGVALRISLLGAYIRSVLWPYIQRNTDKSMPSWEHYHSMHGSSSGVASLTGSLTGVAIGLSLFALGIFAAWRTAGVSLAVKMVAVGFLVATTLAIAILLFIRRGDVVNRTHR